MIIEVYRAAGERPGTPIVEPLLADALLIERGRAEMDAHAQAFDQVELEVVSQAGVRLGQVIEVADPGAPLPWRAKVVGIKIAVGLAQRAVFLTLEQPR